MPFKLLVVHNVEGGGASPPESYVFSQNRVVMGRESTNDLHLNDPKRVVSKQHAEIVQTGEAFQITDLGSKNFTLLNNERLQAGRSYDLKPGDTIQIGDFDIRLEIMDQVSRPSMAPPAADFDQTVFDASFVNPFEDGIALLATALRDLIQNYEKAAPSRRDDALEEALRDALDDRGEKALDVIARLRGGTTAPMPAASPPAARPPAAPPPVAPPPMAPPPVTPAPSMIPPTPPPHATPVPTGRSGMESPRMHEVLDLLLRFVAQLIVVPGDFKFQFCGMTRVFPEEKAFLYDDMAGQRGVEQRAELIKQHLLDPSAPPEDVARRLQLLEEAVDDVLVHQVALLDGYRASVREGAERLIDQLNPDAVEEEVAKANVLYKILRPLAKAEALNRLKEQLRQLRGEDWAAAEGRTYRPAFIKAYLTRMNASRRSAGSTGTFD